MEVTLVPNGTAYTLTYTMPLEWLSAKDRAWPVVLDPVIQAYSEVLNILDNFVGSGGSEDFKHGTMYCGYISMYGKTRTFIQYVNLPALCSADVVVDAQLSLLRHGGTDNITTVEAHKVNADWDSTTITWANQPAHNTSVEDYAQVGGNGRYTWEVTDVVRDWYARENTGVMLRTSDSVENAATNNWKKFYSIDYDVTDPNTWPYLTITFRNSNGIEDYWDYTVNSAGRAGTGYVNNYSGNLTWIHSDIGFGGNRMPVSISHIYNAHDRAANSFGLGNGWRTNFNQTAIVWDQNSSYYVWTDGDGTKHYFLYESAGTYKDEDGLELTLTVSGNTKKITDKYGNASYFDAAGRLVKLENNQQTKSSINITYLSGNLISKITDGVGRAYNFVYTNGLLTRISYVGTGTTELAYVSFAHTGTLLTSITDQDGEGSSFAYDSGNFLVSAQDIDGYELRYTYSSGSPKRVIGISEYDGTVPGGSLSIEYAHNQTTFTDHNGNVQIKQFNDWGNVVSVQDDEGRAQYAQYARKDYDENAAKANQLTVSSKLQNTVSNMFKNNSFEDSTAMWSINSTTITMERSSEAAYLGNYSMKLVASVEDDWYGSYGPQRSVEPGETVTFSAYIKTVDANVALAIERNTNYALIVGTVVSAGQDWSRYQMSYTNTSSATEYFHGYFFVRDPGTVYIDCVQIEKTSTASRYNLINNGNFIHGDYGWSKSSAMTTSDQSIATDAAIPELDATAYRITGSPTAAKYLSQTVYVSGAKDDSFVLSGWAKGDSAPLTDSNRAFGLMVTFNHTDGNSNSEEVSFNADCDSRVSWQYAATPAVATAAYSSITVQVCYSYNVNTVYFDGIQLFKEEFGNSYTYDGNGNIKSVVDLQKQRTEYEYTANDLTKIIQGGATQMTYTYDNWNNVKTATTASGEVYEFTYDTYGNNTKVEIKNGEQFISSTATYSADGNILVSTTDALAKTTTYGYNENTNVLEWVQYPNDTESTRTEYTYDTMYRLAAATADVNTGYTLTASYTYTDDMLTKIETGSTTYSFSYGDCAQRSSIQIGSRTLATYSYTADANRYLSALNYGNGDSVQYTYDDYGRVIQQTYEDGSTVTYSYDNMGALATVTDSATGRKTTYYYDLTDRLMKYVETGTDYSHSAGYEYDSRNNLTKLVETIGSTTRTTAYTYDENNRITRIAADSADQVIGYDALGRIESADVYNASNRVIDTQYAYAGEPIAATSSKLSEVYIFAASGSFEVWYLYDDNGNITHYRLIGPESLGGISVWIAGQAVLEDAYYHYDSANQLIREDNRRTGMTTVWEYDDAGNITSCTLYPYTSRVKPVSEEPLQTNTYTYGDSAWGDLLTAYYGFQWSYDQIGNLTNDGTWTYTWRNGRELASMSSGSTTWTYTYDANGMRTSRSNGSTTYSYVYNGSQLTQMTRGTDTLYFTYGVNGPTTVTWNGTTYYYAVNGQGDVVGIFDGSGNCVVAYNWDNAWGGNPAPKGTLASTLGRLNPLRYRSYVYDQETGLYYLQSRYYNPKTSRFLNADAFAATGQGCLGNNMFAYCLNSPLNYVDTTGHMAMLKDDKLASTSCIGFYSGSFGGGNIAPIINPSTLMAEIASGICAIVAVATGILKPVEKEEEKAKAAAITKKLDDPVIFPLNPNDFNPAGLVKKPRDGTINGALISWMDPLTNTEVFRWDENPNYPNGPHYHINNPIYRKAKVHFYPADVVPEPYATIYFPFG